MCITSKPSKRFFCGLFCVFIVHVICVDDFATLKQIDFIAKASTHRCAHLRFPSEYTILCWPQKALNHRQKLPWRDLIAIQRLGDSCKSSLPESIFLRVALVLFRSMVVAQVASIANCIPWTLGSVWAWIIIAGNLYTLHANEMCWLFGIRNLGRKAFEGWSWWGLASYSMLRRRQCDMIQETQGLPLSFLQEEETARATSVTKTASADEFLTEAQEHGVTSCCQDFVENDKPRDVVTPRQSHDARDGRRLDIFDPIQSRRCFQWQAQACRCRPRHREHWVQDIRRFDEAKIVGIVTAVGFDGGVTWCNEMCLEPFLDDYACSDPTVLWLIHDCHTGSFYRTAARSMACTQDFDWMFRYVSKICSTFPSAFPTSHATSPWWPANHVLPVAPDRWQPQRHLPKLFKFCHWFYWSQWHLYYPEVSFLCLPSFSVESFQVSTLFSMSKS